VVYLTRQIHQFRLLGKEFAMQHLGAEDELKQVLRDLLATMSPQERLEGLPARERLEGLSLEERLEGLTPEQLQRLQQLLQARTKPDDSSRPE
jgi:hypothetical protein